jgi:hypothetical protein
MREFTLCKELNLKLAKDLGATPFTFGKISLTHHDLLTNINIQISDENGNLQKIPVWYGEAIGSESISCGILAGLYSDSEQSSPDEFVFVLGFKNFNGEFQTDGIRLSLHYDWTNNEDPGTLVMKVRDKWITVSLAQRLQLILGFETMVQEGVMWQASSNIPEELRKDLVEIIEVDEKNS